MGATVEPLRTLLQGFAEAVLPLADELSTSGGVQDVLADLGLLVEDTPDSLSALATRVESLREQLDHFAQATESEQVAEIITAALALGDEVVATIEELDGLPDRLRAELTEFVDDLETVDIETVAARLLDRLLIDYLSTTLPPLVPALSLLGLVDSPWSSVEDFSTTVESDSLTSMEQLADTDDLSETLTVSVPTIYWDRFETLVTDPRALFETVYGWGGEDYDGRLIVRRMHGFLRTLGFRSSLDASGHSARPPLSATIGGVEGALGVPLFHVAGGPIAVEAGISLGTFVPDGLRAEGGLAAGLYLEGDAGVELPVGNDVSLIVDVNVDIAGGLVLSLQPPFEMEAILDPAGAVTATSVSGDVSLRYAPEDGFRLLGLSGTAELRAAAIEAGLTLDLAGSDVALGAQARLVDGTLEIGGEEGDSFLAEILGSGVTASFDVGVRWSPDEGVTFEGSTGLEVTIPIGVSLGPINIDELTIDLFVDAGGADLKLRATGSFELGPLAVSVDGVGVALSLTATEQGGNLGRFQIEAPTFVPPDGLGISVDLSIVTGGGYLYLDHEAGEYGGVLELEMLNVGVTAIGLLATQLPAGAPGWSLFFSLTATFTGVQLGFGFTLNGLGGLIGINRGLDEEVLGDGIRTGALDSILFPDDPVADAPRILSDIDAIFPVAVGQYVFGPVAKIGWGTPTLLEVDLGIVIQLPEPFTVTLLGALEALLPDEDVSVLELRVDVAGTLNLTEGTLRIDASLSDSRVLTLELTGDMAVRASFFSAATFLFATGGFHPEFRPPDDFPTLRRLGVALDTGDNLRITLGGYFALTSNTVQFGAEFAIWAEAVGFTAEGGASFDALIQFKPFGFAIAMRVWVSISAGNFDLMGVLLAGDLSGPNPWAAVGEAEFKLLGIKTRLEIAATFGQKEPAPPTETVFVGDLLIEELSIDSAWSALPPEGDGNAGVVVADISSDALEVHPSGRIEVRQRIVPLDTRIDHYGNAQLGGADRFELSAPRVGHVSLDWEAEPVEDFFAAAHYFKLDEDEKLSAPSFEQMPSGLRLGDDVAAVGPEVTYTYDHEVVYRDPSVRQAEREHTGTRTVATQAVLDRAVSTGTALSARQAAGLPHSEKSQGNFAVTDAKFVVTDALTGNRLAETPRRGVGYYAAREAVRTVDDSLSRAIVPAYELELME